VARVVKQKAAAAGLAGPRARGGSFIGRPRVPWRVGLGVARQGKAVSGPDSTQVRARLEHEVGEDPDRWVFAVRKRGGKERGKLGRWPARRGKREQAGPGRAGEKERRRKTGWVGPRGRKRERGKRKREWVEPKGKKREKKNCIQIHLNLNLKFKFKWKTNDKTMQWHKMRKTYISLYFF
jgi:hypothetical protein